MYFTLKTMLLGATLATAIPIANDGTHHAAELYETTTSPNVILPAGRPAEGLEFVSAAKAVDLVAEDDKCTEKHIQACKEGRAICVRMMREKPGFAECRPDRSLFPPLVQPRALDPSAPSQLPDYIIKAADGTNYVDRRASAADSDQTGVSGALAPRQIRDCFKKCFLKLFSRDQCKTKCLLEIANGGSGP